MKVDGDRMLQLHRDTFFIPVIDIFLTITNARLRPRFISVGSNSLYWIVALSRMGYAREDWIVTSPQRVSTFAQNAKCGDSTTSTDFSLLTLLICQCPPRSVIFPPCSRSPTIYTNRFDTHNLVPRPIAERHTRSCDRPKCWTLLINLFIT